MELQGPTLYYAPWRFPPTPERLIRLVESFAGLGYRSAVLDWGGLFPWSEERFRGTWFYPEHAVVEAHKRATGSGLVLLPKFPFGNGMSNFLADPAFRRLRMDRIDPDVLDPAAPGAAKFVCDLLDDMRALLPDIEGIYVDPVGGCTGDDSYAGDLLREVFPRLLDAAAGLPVVAPSEAAGLPGIMGKCVVLPSEAACWRPVERRNLPPTIEIHLDFLSGTAGGMNIGGVDLAFPSKIREKFERFSLLLDRCWDLVRAAAEDSALPPALGNPLERSRAVLKRSIGEVEKTLLLLSECACELDSSLHALIIPGVLSGWTRSRIDSLRDQLGPLHLKYRMVEAWINTE